MTKDEFITGWMTRSRIDLKYRTPNGYKTDWGVEDVCVKCNCDYEDCKGFAMIPLDTFEREIPYKWELA